MAPVTVSRRNDRRGTGAEWTPRISVTRRILAVNIFALLILAGGFFYLDSYRARLIDGRLVNTARETALIATAIEAARPDERAPLLMQAAQTSGIRLRLYDSSGAKTVDSFDLAPPTYALVDPRKDPIRLRLARGLDRVVETIALAAVPGYLHEPSTDRLDAWPEAKAALATGRPSGLYRFAPDRTPFLSAARPIFEGRAVLFATLNARDITEIVRAERLRISLVLVAAILISILLSLFLARTIVLPLRRLARAAVRVRLGRAREVIVPRLPDRRDEIGMLARAISDMSQALRQRIDATETFAADVSHELKNPIASLRSALEGLASIKDEALRRKLLDIAQDDVRRLDRLVTDIAEASRIDAQLSRTPFELVDMGRLVGRVVRTQSTREAGPQVRISYSRPPRGSALAMGDPQKLSRVLDNLIDNARSFSPENGRVRISVESDQSDIHVFVDDEGPGVPEKEREAIFRRFHSVRPEQEGFGKHSGLGLAIARTILEGHNGAIAAEDRPDAAKGARFHITLPRAWPEPDDTPEGVDR
ncbi:MAG: sensor N-terminal transmembrane domain-containing protein [Sphingobium sp.]|nr:sensor N-terminal transmembrane domain-containing protein [Sphingobium sp.]